MKVAIYLRKSRADEELEKTLGQGETLSKHRKALLKFAKEKKLNIVDIKEEIVSGESLFHRPKMLELLSEVENKQYDGVLVMDMQRLGRGDMKDQGVILETFKNSNTKIITPQKTYDLNNDFDEEYSEFEAFMSRKELKMINRRMQGGRVRSIEDGNYISANPPFGYDIHYIGKSRTLTPNQVESEVVKLIFDMYVNGNGSGAIADYLNSLGYKSKTGKDFERSSVIFILKNMVYIGKLTWKKKEIKKSKDPNKNKDTRTRDLSEWIIVDGKHPAIISEDIFNRAQEILKGKYHVPYKLANGAANPLAGLIICKVCGSKMVMRKYTNKDPHIMCSKKCGNKSSKFKYVESAIITAFKEYYEDVKSNIENSTSTNDDLNLHKKHLDILKKDLSTLNSQKLNLYDLVEQGIYDSKTFLERSNNINVRITRIENEIKKIETTLEKQSQKTSNIDIKIKNVIDLYKFTKDISEKNELLKTILIKAEYLKLKEQRNDDFEIKIYPKE